jgi:hypothetical protein
MSSTLEADISSFPLLVLILLLTSISWFAYLISGYEVVQIDIAGIEHHVVMTCQKFKVAVSQLL